MSTFTVPGSRTKTKNICDMNATQYLVDPEWEKIDPIPDIHSLFREFDKKFFNGKLECVALEWSKKMYTCAGICYYRRNAFGTSCIIRLSEPLLKFRSRKELIETLLHEMIHAFCFVLNIREGNGGHGPNFQKMMHSINQRAGTNITVYHSFHDEVDLYKVHWWRCDGPCVNRKPYYGFVKRTSNRAPGPNDRWWAVHQQNCGGKFVKVKEPEKNKPNKENETKRNNKKNVVSSPKPSSSTSDIRKFFSPNDKPKAAKETGNIMQFKDLSDTDTTPETPTTPHIELFKGTGHVLGGSSEKNPKKSRLLDEFEIKIIAKKPRLMKSDPIIPPEAPQNIKQEMELEFSDGEIILIDDEFDEEKKDKVDITGDTKLIDQYFNSSTIDLTDMDLGFESVGSVKNEASDRVNNSSKVPDPVVTEEKLKELRTNYDILIDCGYSEEETKYAMKDDYDLLKRNGYLPSTSNDISEESGTVKCPSCCKKIPKDIINDHLDNCLNEIEKDDSFNDGAGSSSSHSECPVCFKIFHQDEINGHLDKCLN